MCKPHSGMQKIAVGVTKRAQGGLRPVKSAGRYAQSIEQTQQWTQSYHLSIALTICAHNLNRSHANQQYMSLAFFFLQHTVRRSLFEMFINQIKVYS